MNALRHAYDFDPWAALLAVELDEPFEFPGAVVAYAGVELFHPGAGKIRAINGRERVEHDPATREFRLKIEPGDNISTRNSAGQDVGYVLYTGETPEQRHAVHRRIEKDFEIVLASSGSG